MPYIEQREMTAAAWTSLNPVLLKGEVGWESGANPKAKKGDGTTAWNSLAYWLDTPTINALIASKAPSASPVFTGDPKAPTPATSDNDTSIATTAFVQAVVTALIAGSPALLNTLKELADAIGDDPNFAATMTAALALKAPLASPTFTGDPKAPTPATSDNDTSIATTAFVQALIASFGYAPLASPTFTGDPKAPTPATSDNDTSIATTAFVQAAIAADRALQVLSNTAALTFGAIGAQTSTATASATQTITVTGAAVGDVVLVGPPAAINTGLIWQAWVSATNTVSIRLFNHTSGSITPTAASTWRATVIH